MAGDGEVNVLLVITVIIGTILMTSLLACYICVFRQLCCEPDGSSPSYRGKRSLSMPHRDSVNMAELTHISSQPTETDRV
uniref:Uncharacterized protein n=1 Tax=Phlebotomus papatasi TaxID=29031 RepID=A0A1B0D084_PHLPP